MPDELMYVVGSACARISDNSSPRAWYKLFTPTRDCELGLNEAQLLANHEQYGLALLRLFKELEREIDRLVGGTSSGTANRLLDTLKNRGYVTEWEFHFLNGIRALRNEFSHGRSSEPTEEESRMIYALNDGVILLASFLLAKLNSLGR